MCSSHNCCWQKTNSSDRTKHVDICFHLIRQHIQGTVKVEFVRSRENDADLFTKKRQWRDIRRTQEKMVWMQTEYERAAQDSTTGRVLEDVVNLPKTTSPYLLKMISPIESHFNITEKRKG